MTSLENLSYKWIYAYHSRKPLDNTKSREPEKMNVFPWKVAVNQYSYSKANTLLKKKNTQLNTDNLILRIKI